jgi:cytosine/adenosine deaminase-related metal-dependent hydrolase
VAGYSRGTVPQYPAATLRVIGPPLPLEEGKQADFVVIDRDLLTCPEDEIREARALTTYLDGKRVFERQD